MSEIVAGRAVAIGTSPRRRHAAFLISALFLAAVGVVLGMQTRADGIVCDKTFVGPSGGDWMDGANWTPSGVPTSTENACASDLVSLSASTTVAAVDLDGGLDQNFGTLNLASATELSTIDGLGSNGQIEVAFELELTGTNSFGFGESFQGPGTLRVAAGATLDLQTDSRIGDSDEVVSATIENLGTVTHGGGNLFFHNGTRMVNSGTFSLPSGGTLRWFSPVIPNPEPSIVNESGGTLDLADFTSIELPFENDGDVAVATSVELAWPDGLDEDDGTYTTADSSAEVRVWGHRSFTNAAPLLGDGLLATKIFQDASLEFAGATVDRLSVRRGSTGGDLTISGHLQLGDSGDGSADVNLAGAGTTIVAPGATVAFGDDDFTSLTGGHVLRTQAALTIPSAGMGVCGTSELRNESALTLEGDLSCSSSPHGPLRNEATGTVLVDGVDVAVSGALHNDGTITVDGGSIAAGGGTHTGSLVLTQAADTAELGFGANASFTGTASVTGLGELRARQVTWASTSTIARLAVVGNGVFTGTATITGALDVDGSLTGPGTVTIAATATADMDPAQGLGGAVQVVNQGAMVQSNTIEMCDGAAITNEGTWSVEGTILFGGGCTPASVTNTAAGAITLTGAWTSHVPFTNAGTLDLAGFPASFVVGSNSGTLIGPGALTLSGTFDLGLITTTDIDINVEGGTVDAAAGSELAVLRLGGGSFVGEANVTSLLEVVQGGLGGAGTTTLAPAATLTFDGFPEVLAVAGSHHLRLANSSALNGTAFIPQVIVLCDASQLSVAGSLSLLDGGIKDCGGSTAVVHVEGGGTLSMGFPGAFGLTTPVDVPVVNDGEMFTSSFSSATLAAFTNNGTFSDTFGSQLTMSTITNTGTFEVPTATLAATTVTNTGTLSVGDASFDSLSNFSGSTIAGGTLEVHGTLAVDGIANLLTNSADLTIGPLGQITDELANDRLKVRTNTATGRFRLERNHAVAIFSNSGVVEVSSAAMNASSGYFQTIGTTVVEGGSISKSQFFGGRVEGNGFLGSIVRVSGATLAPGYVPGDVGGLFGGTVSMTATTRFEADLQPGCGCSADLVGATSSVAVDGTLALSGEGDPGYEAILVSGPRTGLFHTVTGTFVAPSTNLLVDYDDFGVYVLTSPPPEIALSPSSGGQVVEGTDVSPTQYAVDVSLSWPAAGTIAIDVVPTDGTATSPSEFDATPQTVTFLPGETEQTVTIDVVADNRFENDETFEVALANLVGDATFTPDPTTVTIIDDDPLTATTLTDTVDAVPGDGSCDDGTGACTLRAAIMEANALPGAQNLNLVSGGSYMLTIPGRDEDGGATGDLDITDEVVINSNGATIDAAGLDRVFDVHTTGVTVTGYGTLTGGSTLVAGGDLGHGGGVLVRSGAQIAIENFTVQGNAAAGSGGGVAVFGAADLLQVFVTDSTAGVNGGGLFAGTGASIAVSQSTVFSNEATLLGGGMAAEGTATLTVLSTGINDNDAQEGGGGLSLRTGASLTMSSSAVNGNYGHIYGGGLHVQDASATIDQSFVNDNTTLLYAGGILQLIGTITITDTQIDGNEAAAGGGILTGYATLDIERSTISNNVGIVSGGGIGSGSLVAMQNSTISGNTSPIGAGFYNHEDLSAFFRGDATFHSVTFGPNNGPAFTGIGGSILSVTNSLFAPHGGITCVLGSPATSGGFNLTADTSCGFGHVEDLVGDAELGVLGFNGGITPTHMPEFWAIDTGGACLPEDQRGFSRPQGLDCDRGAVDQ